MKTIGEITYNEVALLKEGEYSDVWKVDNGRVEYFTVKKFYNETRFFREFIIYILLKEIRRYEKYICPIIDAYFFDGGGVILQEFMLMDMQAFIPIAESQLIRIFNVLCKAVRFLHSNHFVHRDIKPGNILVNNKMQVKLCDLGYAAWEYDLEDIPIFAGTQIYMAPEYDDVISGSRTLKFTFDELVAADVFSLGLVMKELLIRYTTSYVTPFEELRDVLLFTYPRCSIPNAFSILFNSMLMYEPKSRCSINTCLNIIKCLTR